MIQATIDSISASTADGLGIVSIAHRLSTVRSSDLIYVLSRGQLVEQGSHAGLMEKKGTYYALVAAQESVHQADAEETVEMSPVPRDPTLHAQRSSTHPGESETQRVRREKEAEANREKEISRAYKARKRANRT